MALRHRNKQRRKAGEPIYPIGNMCEHPNCRKAGQRFAVDNFITWLCKKHQRDLPEALFSEFNPYAIDNKDGTITHRIPLGEVLIDGTLLARDCVISFSQQAKVIDSHRDENGITIITKHEYIGSPQPLTSVGFSIENNFINE